MFNIKLRGLLICSMILILMITIIGLFIYYENLNQELEDNITALENRVTELKAQIKPNNEDFTQKYKDKIKQDYNWLTTGEWDKVTITDRYGNIVDITNNELFQRRTPTIKQLGWFNFEYSVLPVTIKLYTYTFYYGNEIKEIAVYLDGKLNNICKNPLLYEMAKALMPVDDSLQYKDENIINILLNTTMFVDDYTGVILSLDSLSTLQYLLLVWMPDEMIETKEMPNNIEPRVTIKGFTRGENVFIKIYDYNNKEGNFIELKFKDTAIFYEKNIKDNTNTIYKVFGTDH